MTTLWPETLDSVSVGWCSLEWPCPSKCIATFCFLRLRLCFSVPRAQPLPYNGRVLLASEQTFPLQNPVTSSSDFSSTAQIRVCDQWTLLFDRHGMVHHIYQATNLHGHVDYWSLRILPQPRQAFLCLPGWSLISSSDGLEYLMDRTTPLVYPGCTLRTAAQVEERVSFRLMVGFSKCSGTVI